MVAETGSITAAAKALNVSQPALSKQLKTFESFLDTKLFEKHGRGLQLTSVGLSLFGQARGIFEKVDYLSREFSSSLVLHREQFRIGFDGDCERTFASEIAARLFSRPPRNEMKDSSLATSTVNGDSLARYLLEHVVDACISERRLSGSGLVAAASCSRPACLIFPAKSASRLKKARRDDLQSVVDALNLPWILPTSNLRFRYEIADILAEITIDVRPVLETDSIQTLIRAVSRGLGMGFVPSFHCRRFENLSSIIVLDKIRLLPLTSVYLWVRRSERETTFIQRLTRTFQEIVQ